MFRFFLLLSILISSCAKKNFKQEHQDNITEVNQFRDFEEFEAPSLEPINEELDQKKSNIRVKDISISTFCNILSKIYNKNIYANDPQLFPQKIYFNLTDVSFNQVLKHLALTYNIGYEEIGEDFVLYSPQRKTKMFQINYHNFERKSSSAIRINSTSLDNASTNDKNHDSNFSSIETTSQENFWANVETMLSSILMKDLDINKDEQPSKESLSNEATAANKNLSISRNNGLVMVRAYPKTMAFIQEYIETVNKSLMEQIMIEIKILEVSLNENFASGIQWNFLKNNFNFSFNKQAKSSSDLNVLTGAIESKNFSTFINALSTQGKISVLSSPMINTLNNQRALIKFGEDKFFVTNISNVSLSNATNVNSVTSGYEFKSFFSGIALDTTASIKDNNKILMHVHPIISRVSSDDVIVEVDSKKTTLPMAKVQSREADSIILANSGNIIVLGGITESAIKSESSELPLDKKHLGKLTELIKNNSGKSSKKELIILLKPTIIKNMNHNMKSSLGYK